jgi:hypothetical protein
MFGRMRTYLSSSRFVFSDGMANRVIPTMDRMSCRVLLMVPRLAVSATPIIFATDGMDIN